MNYILDLMKIHDPFYWLQKIVPDELPINLVYLLSLIVLERDVTSIDVCITQNGAIKVK